MPNYRRKRRYLCFIPAYDNSIKYKVPANSPLLKDLMTREEIDRLLLEIPHINVLNMSDKQIEQTYKALMNNGTHEDLVKIIKTTYLRNQLRILNNKKISEKDDEYLKRAEKYLYEEIGVVLNMSFEQTKEYVIKKISELQK